jgi:hypothetical protein
MCCLQSIERRRFEDWRIEASIVIKNQIAMMQGDDLFAGRGNTLEWGEQNVVDE